MAAPFITDQSNYTFAAALNAGDYIDVGLPYHQANDILVLVCNYYPSPNIPTAPAAPAGWQAPSGATYLGEDRQITGEAVQVWWWYRATSGSTPSPRIVRPDATGASDSDTHLSACAFVVRGCVTFGDPFESRNHIANSSGFIPAVTSTNVGSTAIAIITATHYGVIPFGPASPYGYSTVSAKYSFYGAGAGCVLMSRPVDVGTIPQGESGYDIADPLGGFNDGDTFAFVAIPTADVGVDEVPITVVPIRGPGRDDSGPLQLGCADEYECFITGPDYEDRIDAVRFSSLDWERVLDDTSAANVSLPDEFGGASCIARFGGLKPWRYGLTIERDGRVVWRGPVTSVKRRAGGIQVGAHDVFARFKMRLATRVDSLRFVNNDAGQMFSDVLNTYARVIYDQWEFPVPQVVTGVGVTRNVVAREFNKAWDVVKDLLDSSIDAYVIAGCPVVFQPQVGWVYVGALGEQYYLAGEHTAGGELVYGLFTEESFTEIPDWSINGFQQANASWVAGADSGQAGFRKYWTSDVATLWPEDSILDVVETTGMYRASEGEAEPPDSVFQRRADSLVMLRAQAPAVVESVSLTQTAPVNVDHLRPGSIWRMDIWDAGWGQLLQAARLKRVKVEVSADSGGVTESVSASLYPLGYTEGDV